MEFITWVFNVLMALVLKVIKIILIPIDYAIEQFLPDLSSGFTAIANFLTIIAQGIGWAISATGVPYSAIALIGSVFIFKLTLPISIWFIKLVLSWYHTVKP